MNAFRHIYTPAVDRRLEALLRSSAGRRVRPATVIRCGAAADPFTAAELEVAELVGAAR